MTTKRRVLVVDDSATVRQRLCQVIDDSETFEVVAQAADGQQAIELCETLRPDVVTMDMMLPVMTGLAATEYIMARCPTPILVVSSSFNRGEVFKTYDALAAGAVDVLEKPTGEEPPGAWEKCLLSALRVVSRVCVVTRRNISVRAPSVRATTAASTSATEVSVVAVGTSTGGPGALVELLKGVPASFPTPILIVLHLSPNFAEAFADWLDAQLACRVAFAKQGERLEDLAGQVRLAPADSHLFVDARQRLGLSQGPERNWCRPSVDVLFESIALNVAPAALGCLLTGMGRDGAEGLLAMRRAGCDTIAQDEESSVVYGMPREAVALGAAARVLSLAQIARSVEQLGRGTR